MQEEQIRMKWSGTQSRSWKEIQAAVFATLRRAKGCMSHSGPGKSDWIRIPVNTGKFELIMGFYNSQLMCKHQNSRCLRRIWRQTAVFDAPRNAYLTASFQRRGGGRERSASNPVRPSQTKSCCAAVAIRFLARDVLMLYRSGPNRLTPQIHGVFK